MKKFSNVIDHQQFDLSINPKVYPSSLQLDRSINSSLTQLYLQLTLKADSRKWKVRTKAKSMHLGSPSTQLKITLKPNHLAKSSRQKKKKTCLLYRSTMKTSAAHIQFSPRLYFRPGDNWSVLLLSKYFQMWNMSTKRLKEGLLVIVPHPKLLTRLTDDGSNLRIVKLTHAREEVMGCLMIESSWK